MSGKSSITALIQRLSPRERLLGGLATALLLIIGLVYGAMIPGLNGARSAATRNASAAADLALIRSLAASSGTGAPAAIDAGALRLSAETAGLAVGDLQAAEDVLTMTVTAGLPQTVLSWLAANSGAAAVESFVIEAGPAGSVSATIRFVGVTP